MTRQFSIIIPVLDEAGGVESCLLPLQDLRRQGHELIVVDGGSCDATATLAEPLADRVLHSGAGRARQMNAGARLAQGEVFLFLHADTRLPEEALKLAERALDDSRRCWGRFDVELSGQRRIFRVIGFMINLRSRWSGIATGDQALFVRRETFEYLGGFPDLPLMEDVAFSKRLLKQGRPVCLRSRVHTSSRRWESHGVLRTILLMWQLRLAFFLGVKPEILHRKYYKKNI